MQTRRHSLIESTVNTGSGFLVSYAIGFVILPLFGHSFGAIDLGWITLVYTAASVIRNYLIRRLFNVGSKDH